MNIIDKIEKDHYVATEAQVESLAREQYTAATQAGRANSTYLRVLIVGCQAELGPARRGRALGAEAQMAVLEKVHDRYYAAVLRGVTTDDVAHDDTLERTERGRRQLERNRRSGFARSAATTVRNYIRAGGDVRSLEPSTTSKSALQKAAKGEPSQPSNRVVDRIQRAEQALIRAVHSQARGDPELAAATLEAIMERLQQALDNLLPDKPVAAGAKKDPVVGERFTRTRVGTPFMRLPT